MPDYASIRPEEAVQDFLNRIDHYNSAYQPLDTEVDKDLSFIKFIDVGKQIIMNNIRGYIASRAVFLLMNMHITPSVIWLTRHGESEFNALGKIGGDSDLTDQGKTYSKMLAKFIDMRLPKGSPLIVWTSTLKRSINTAKHLDYPVVHWKALEEIDSGICDGMTYEEIEQKMPDEFMARAKNKFK